MPVRLRKFERELWFPTFSANLCGNAYYVGYLILNLQQWLHTSF